MNGLCSYCWNRDLMGGENNMDEVGKKLSETGKKGSPGFTLSIVTFVALQKLHAP
jgi:hypothetical protein